jgi:hypothetical protein
MRVPGFDRGICSCDWIKTWAIGISPVYPEIPSAGRTFTLKKGRHTTYTATTHGTHVTTLTTRSDLEEVASAKEVGRRYQFASGVTWQSRLLPAVRPATRPQAPAPAPSPFPPPVPVVVLGTPEYIAVACPCVPPRPYAACASLAHLFDSIMVNPESGGPSSFDCQVCSRRYERLDHLNRHLDSREHF